MTSRTKPFNLKLAIQRVFPEELISEPRSGLREPEV
jgi:hypothetical protein